MSVYIGPWRRSFWSGLFWRTICFTGWQVWFFRLWLVGFGALQGAIIGFIIGLMISIITIGATAEFGPAVLISVAIGAATTVLATEIGAGIGAVAGAAIAYLASCTPCGMCIEMAFRMVLGRLIPMIPILILPRTADCTLIPPGCP